MEKFEDAEQTENRSDTDDTEHAKVVTNEEIARVFYGTETHFLS